MILYRRVVWWYLATPILLFMLTWYNPLIGWPLFALLSFAIYRVSPSSDVSPVDGVKYRYLIMLTIGVAVFLTWGAMVMNYFDWPKHRAVFFDLSRCRWPYAYDMGGTPNLFSFYVTYYLPPALIAKTFGMHWLPKAIELWTEMGYGLALWGYFSRSKTIYEWLFLLFLVMSLAGWIVLEESWRIGKPPHDPFLFEFYWVPQHVIPAWLAGALFFQPDLKPQDKARFGVLLLVLVAYWSPFVAIGFAPFVVVEFFSKEILRNTIRNWWVYVISLCLIFPYYLYLSRGITNVPHGWAFPTWHDFFIHYIYTFTFQWAALVATVGLLAVLPVNKKYLAVSTALLLLLPLYNIGIFQDLTSRGTLVAYYFVLTVSADGGLYILRHVGATDDKAGQRLARMTGAHVLLLLTCLGPWSSTIPVIETIAGRHFPPVRPREFFPPITVGLQTLMRINRLIRVNGLAGQYITETTPVKEQILRPIEVCQPESKITE